LTERDAVLAHLQSMNVLFLIAGQAIGAAPAASAAASVAEVAATGGSAAVSPWGGLLSTVVSLLFVLALAWLLLRWLRRNQIGTAGGEGPRVMRAVGLGPRERLVVVQHRDVEYLLGVTAHTISVIERRQADAAHTDDAVPGQPGKR
jgi:flagellar biogenesis protein FliO